ncbi:hypothetical protein [Rhizobium sp. BK251]|uniref:hypothetical protein n=1 Tax=Rhizobium sp. BK251 TaxID=2512125 RepID=UPI0010CF3BC2|nr:hypothetical protein [Rhizobium sp. BK251]TCL62917.1 hypothetical protein EV286_11823 [Rhizobium sp. BK251]
MSNQPSIAGKDRIVPGAEWDELKPGDAGWSSAHLASLARDLADGRSTALMIIDAGHVVFQWGDVACKSSVASVRKSLINILYGIYTLKAGSIQTIPWRIWRSMTLCP